MRKKIKEWSANTAIIIILSVVFYPILYWVAVGLWLIFETPYKLLFSLWG